MFTHFVAKKVLVKEAEKKEEKDVGDDDEEADDDEAKESLNRWLRIKEKMMA